MSDMGGEASRERWGADGGPAIEIDGVGTQLARVDAQDFGRRFAMAGIAAEQYRRLEWLKLIEQWLDTKAARSHSESTRRNYRAALERWMAHLAGHVVEEPHTGIVRTVELWECDQSHVRSWQTAMRARGLSESTINHQLSCVSSFYSFVINEKRMVQGVEVDMFTDRLGRTRENPFKVGNLQRGRVEQYQRARHLTLDEYRRLLTYLEQRAHTMAGARNNALIRTYLHTGWRASELLRMRWRDIRPSRAQVGSFVFAWRGKGAKSNDDVLPSDCYHAILAYLKLAGRWTPGAPGRESGLTDDEFVWLPVAEPDMRGMAHGAEVDPTRPISEKSALRVLRGALRGAGIAKPETFRVHDLRHTHAHLLLETGQNLAVIQARLHHSSLATTGLYVRQVHRGDPVDAFSAQFAQLRLGVA